MKTNTTPRIKPDLKIKNKPLSPSKPVKSDLVNHQFEQAELTAVWGAYHAGRPLLLKGEPGTGKSQFAKALAQHLGWAYVRETMHGAMQLEDLHWHYDAVHHLGQAHAIGRGVSHAGDADSDIDSQLAYKNFIRPGAFAWAYDWEWAASQYSDDELNTIAPHTPDDWNHKKGPKSATQGVVLLIDELDKAEPDLPNGLLQTLGDFEFVIPQLNQRIRANSENLIVVITTNNERDLPQALLRRCFCHTLTLPNSQDGMRKWLTERGKLHFGTAISDVAYEYAAEELYKERQDTTTYSPGLAEYLDLLRPLAKSKVPPEKQMPLLKEISQYTYQKGH